MADAPLEGIRKILETSHEDLAWRFRGKFPTGYVQFSLEKGKRLAKRAHELAFDGPSFDLGCGDGMWALYIAALGRESYGIDIDHELIRKAKENLRCAGDQGIIKGTDPCRFEAGNFYPANYHEQYKREASCGFTETIARWTRGNAYQKLGKRLGDAAIIYAYIWPAHMPMAARMLERECRPGCILIFPIGGEKALEHGLTAETLETDGIYETPIMLRKTSKNT